MNIAYLSNSTIPSTAANSVHVMKMCAAMARQGHNVHLFAAKNSMNGSTIDVFKNYGTQENFKIIRTYRPAFRGGQLIYRLLSFCKMLLRKYDIVYARNPYHARLALVFNKPVYLEVHNIPGNIKQNKAIKKIIHSGIMRSLIVISDALKQDYLKLYPELANQTVILAPDGADVPERYLENEEKTTIDVGYVGHLYTGRGAELILDMAKRFPGTMFYIIGGNPEDIEKMKKGSPSNVIFEGFVPNGELYKYYAKFDIALAPYQKKVAVHGNSGDTSKYMSPLKIFEYMAYKKAIICSDLPVLREVLINKENCLLCPYDDLSAWESAINRLIKEKELRKQLANTAYSGFMDRYTWDKRAKTVLS